MELGKSLWVPAPFGVLIPGICCLSQQQKVDLLDGPMGKSQNSYKRGYLRGLANI